MKLPKPTQAELLFHWYRIGNREGLKKLYRVSGEYLVRVFPVTDNERFMRGQMVKVGDFLVKRCKGCATAKELERFYADNARVSGCRAYCDTCRGLGRGR